MDSNKINSTNGKKLFAIRGATGAENTAESIQKNVSEMCNLVFTENNVRAEDIVSVVFTLTSDLTKMNPATALRKGQCPVDVSKVPLFCCQEPEIENSPEKMVRLLLTVYLPEDVSVRHIYINGAEKLRADLAGKK